MTYISKALKSADIKQTLVSVILPVYNSEDFIFESVNSILTQDYFNIELIIIDDGSTDCTLSILNKFDDIRIKLISRENKGLIATLNEAIPLCNGKYIARMDADDISKPDRISKQVQFLEQHSSIVVVGTSVTIIGQKGDHIENRKFKIGSGFAKVRLLFNSCLCHPSTMFRSHILQKYSYNEKYSHAEDFKLWSDIVFDGYKIASMDDLLLYYRVHDSNISKIMNNTQVMTSQLIIKENFFKIGVDIDEGLLNTIWDCFNSSRLLSLKFIFKLALNLVPQVKLSNLKLIVLYFIILLKYGCCRS